MKTWPRHSFIVSRYIGGNSPPATATPLKIWLTDTRVGMEVEIIPLVGPPRRVKLSVRQSETVGMLLERVMELLGASGGFFRLVSNGRVLDDAAKVEEALSGTDGRLFFYPEVLGG